MGKHRDMPHEYREIVLSFLRARDEDTCGICCQPILAATEMGIDHIVSVAHGGTHEPDNVRLVHRVCNTNRGVRSPLLFCKRGHSRKMSNLRIARFTPSGKPVYLCKRCLNGESVDGFVRDTAKFHTAAGDYRRNMPSEYRAIVVALLRERDGDNCGICGTLIANTKEMGIDHIVAVCDGGSHDSDNIRLTHRACNDKRGRTQRPLQVACKRGHSRIMKNLRLAYIAKDGHPVYGCRICNGMLHKEWRNKRRAAGLKVA